MLDFVRFCKCKVFESFGCDLTGGQRKINNNLVDKTNIIDTSFATFIGDNELDYSDNKGHPGKKSHEEWAKHILSVLRERYER